MQIGSRFEFLREPYSLSLDGVISIQRLLCPIQYDVFSERPYQFAVLI